jgi:hypothetical protein
MIHYEDSSAFFSASSAIASFADGVKVPLTHATIGSKPMGLEWILTETGAQDDAGNNATEQQAPFRIVRLVMISPNLDWRKNADYMWKLDNAWMSDVDWGWLHWNSNSYIDSAIQLPNGSVKNPSNVLFECDVMEFHFESILPSGFRRSTDPVVTDTRLVLSDVKLGTYMDKEKNKPHDVYNPCHPGLFDDNGCTIVDGVIASSATVPSTFKLWTSTSSGVLSDWWTRSPLWQKLVASVGCVALVVIMMMLTTRLLRWCHYRQRTKLYQQINPTREEEDLVLQEHENFEDETKD